MTAQEFGEIIRARRETKGLALQDLAARLKLSLNTLRSIEEGSLDRMPHAVYARGFVRDYAQAVGVCPEDIEAGMAALFPEHLFEDVPTVPAPIDGKPANARRGGDKIVALVMVLILLVLPLGMGWYVVSNYGDWIMTMVKRPLSAVTAPQTAPGSTASAARNDAGSGKESSVLSSASSFGVASAAAPPVLSSIPPASAAPEAPPLEQAPADLAPAPAAPASWEGASVPMAESAPVSGKQVSIQAREECWVQATVDGATARSFTVYPGETSLMPYKQKITLVLGNAAGVDLFHNGKPYAVSGKRNEKRTVVFQ